MDNAQKSTVYYSRTNSQHVPYEHLSDHLNSVAKQARCYGNDIGSPQTAYLCGAVHDLGKYSERFQQVLRGQAQHVNHASAGAFRIARFEVPSEVVFAHHGKLKFKILPELKKSLSGNGNTGVTDEDGRTYSVSTIDEYKKADSLLGGDAKINPPFPSDLRKFAPDTENLQHMLYERMLLSCLADADYSCAAESKQPGSIEAAKGAPLDPDACLARLDVLMENKRGKSADNSELNVLRDKTYKECEAAANLKPGMFTLTAPTGIGKTVDMMVFALNHCKIYGKRRIFVVLPYLSIIRQNVRDYREICPDLIEDDSQSNMDERTREYATRYDAPMIVTTSVKFFEGLFKCGAPDCRRLHNIADSVIMFDEVQTLPADLCDATLLTLEELCAHYGCTVLFSSATQPDYKLRDRLSALKTMEIVSSPQALFDKTRRVRIEWKTDGITDDAQLAEKLTAAGNCCVTVNVKKQARALFALLPKNDGSCYMITTDLCPEHRQHLIDEIKARQENGQTVRAVSTSCIEAGVDLDFDELWRALSPLPSIIQCAGRVNRGGKLETGTVTVYIPQEDARPIDLAFANMTTATKLLLERLGGNIDIQDLANIEAYYRLVFNDAVLSRDDAGLTGAIDSMNFAETEKRYKLISEAGCDVIVPYSGKRALYDSLAEKAKNGIDRAFIRQAAPITVHVYAKPEKLPYDKLYWKNGELSNYLIAAPDKGLYDERLGLVQTDQN